MKNTLTALAILLASQASSSSNDIMLDMIEFITSNSKYEYNNEPLPYIQVKSAQELCEAVYSPESLAKLSECTVAGYYDPTLRTIFVADKPNKYMAEEKFFETVIFHELVHYLQYLNKYDESVECQAGLERDAYLLQDKYVEHMQWPEKNRPDMLFALIVSSCRSFDPMVP